jgi:3-oxoacyl-[acyl-carrier protein] reductase
MARLSTLSRSIAGRGALVTGAASGMGRATAHLFADEGAQVAVTDVGKEGVERVVDEIRSAGGAARGWVMNVADDAEVAHVVPEIAAAFGRLDIVVNNAGISRFSPIDGADFMAHWDVSLSVLLTAHVRVIRAALPFLRKSDAGRIVNIASTEALGATKYGSPYTAAKSGVVGLTRSLAVELGPERITVNCICPGPINTGMTAGIPDEHKAIFARRRVALQRYAEPEEVAHGTLNFCLPASQYITGAVLPVDGGMTIKNA